MIDANKYRHQCPAYCDCPDRDDPVTAGRVRKIAGRALTLLQRAHPHEFRQVWEYSDADAHVRLVDGDYYIVASTDRWLRISRIGLENGPGQVTVFSAWLYEHSSDGLNYHMNLFDEIERLENWLEQKFVLDDLARIDADVDV